MAGSPRSVVPALVALVVLTSPAQAFWGRSGSPPSGATAMMPAPVWCYVPMTMPCPGAPAALPPSWPAPTALPKPKAAPTTKEPPLRAPTITESRSTGGVMPAQAAGVAPGRAKVGFWNITGADVTLTIDGQQRKLPKDRALTLELGRTFVWQVEGRGPRLERVPDEQNVFEVILRPQTELKADK